MKIVFISNFYNHHQKMLCEALYRFTGGEFVFIETVPISKERTALGWGETVIPEYVLQEYTSMQMKYLCRKMILDADVAIYGADTYGFIEERLKQNKLTFNYSERIYKSGFEIWKWPVRIYRNQKKYAQYRNFYLLCASAYTAADFSKTCCFRNKAYKWGYFTEVKHYDLEQLFAKKRKKKPLLLWVARLIGWKHPECAVNLAERLKHGGYEFEMNIIGSGPLEQSLRMMIQNKELSECVHLLGAMKPEEVRSHMEEADIFLFTSDFNEGWGAVLNESMNSGCAVVASHAIGAAPCLIEDQKNGLIYRDGDMDGLFSRVTELLQNEDLRRSLGTEAYRTMEETWNADVAAERFIALCEDLLQNRKSTRFCDGPCSKAEILKNNWYY